MAGFKIFISQAMTGRKESEVRNERWFYYELAKLRWSSSNGYNYPELINQFDAPDDMPTFEGLTTEERETKQSLWLLGRSIQMMRDADIIIMVGNPINSKGMMVEYEVLRQYNKNRNTWWFYTDKDMIEWAKQNRLKQFIDTMHIYALYCSSSRDEVAMNEEEEKESSPITFNEEEYKMITKEELHDIMYEYIKPELDKCIDDDAGWSNGSNAGFFYWNLNYGSSASSAVIGSRIIKEHGEIIGFDIYNSFSIDNDYINIRIRKDGIKFIENSGFKCFDHDFMYGLYTKIKEYCGR